MVRMENRVEARLKVESQSSRGQRFGTEMEMEAEWRWNGGRVFIMKVPVFVKRSTESNWVVDSIFELRNIHVREVAYK
jgi:hypothetical protein